MYPDWSAQAFRTLPGCDDDLFNYLWVDRRLRFSEREDPPDAIDEQCARLVCAALARREPLFIVLPDYCPHRSAFLFTTALIRHTSNAPESDINNQVVLYCGSTIGIREQLRLTSVKGVGLDLAEAFRQQSFSKTEKSLRRARQKKSDSFAVKIKKKALGWTLGVSTTGSRAAISKLPKVITAYAPSDPVKLLEHHKPQWVAVDIDESPRALWLQPLLEEAIRQRIPVIAWGVNPLSECMSTFNKYGQVFAWPPRIYADGGPANVEGSAPYQKVTTQLQPYVLNGGSVDDLASILRNANQMLVSESRRMNGRFSRDALLQHWSYVRALESLFVPYDFYEAEAGQIWGLKLFSQLRSGCERFKEYSYQVFPQLAPELEKIFTACEQVAGLIRQEGSLVWNALCNLCIEEPPPDEARLIVFSGRGKKQLFQLALLAYHNICEPDLQSLRTWLLTLDELRRLVRQRSTQVGRSEDIQLEIIDPALNWRPLLVGLPSPQLTPKMLPALVHDSLDVIIYPHQISALKHRSNEWAKAISPDVSRSVQVIDHFSQSSSPSPTHLGTPRLRCNPPLSIDANTAERKARAQVEVLWQPDDPVAEIAKLLQIDDSESADDATYFQESNHDDRSRESETWCEKAVKLLFEGGSHVTFPSDEMINVIRPGQCKSDERFVSSVQQGDRVIFIHGQQRQNFYELIISRVHQHPSMILNLALIERWRTDFVNAYQKWKERGTRNLDGLLRCLNDKGSSLKSSASLRRWLQGRTLCPDEVEDLRRLADVLAMDYVRQHYKRIEHAAKRLRGLHVGLSNRLNRWIEQQAAGIHTVNDDYVIDLGLNLTFGDLRSSLMLLHVEGVEIVEGPLLRSSLGKLED